MYSFFVGAFIGVFLGLLIAGLLGMAHNRDRDW